LTARADLTISITISTGFNSNGIRGRGAS
jgi:hypothetical protein